VEIAGFSCREIGVLHSSLHVIASILPLRSVSGISAYLFAGFDLTEWTGSG
jgi:hypothetical protein